MGTATIKKTKKNIKDIIHQYDLQKEPGKISTLVEEVGEKVVKMKATKSCFAMQDFEKILEKGIAGIGARKNGSYIEIGFRNIENKNIDHEDIIAKLLEEIDENGENNILLIAFKNTMTKILIDGPQEEIVFIKEFIKTTIKLIILANCIEEFQITFLPNDEDEKKLNVEIEKFCEKYFNKKFERLLNNYSLDKTVIHKIINKLSGINSKKIEKEF